MQSSAEGLVTFLPHTLPFLCQPAGGLTGAVVIQSSVPAAAAPVHIVSQQRCALYHSYAYDFSYLLASVESRVQNSAVTEAYIIDPRCSK